MNNLQMREVLNGCIIIDAQPCSQKLLGRDVIRLQPYTTNQVRVLNPLVSTHQTARRKNHG